MHKFHQTLPGRKIRWLRMTSAYQLARLLPKSHWNSLFWFIWTLPSENQQRGCCIFSDHNDVYWSRTHLECTSLTYLRTSFTLFTVGCYIHANRHWLNDFNVTCSHICRESYNSGYHQTSTTYIDSYMHYDHIALIFSINLRSGCNPLKFIFLYLGNIS